MRDEAVSELATKSWPGPQGRRVLLLLVALLALLLMGFYTVTDSSRLAGSHILEGADIIGYAICHRITERSFTIAGRQLPLCARCTGMYLGVSLTFLVFLLAGRRRWSAMPPLRIILLVVTFIGLMAVDGINSYSHFFPNLPNLYEPQNWLRLVTGMGAGLAMGIILFPALSQTVWRDQLMKPALGNIRELAGLVALAALTVILVLSNQPTLIYVLGLVSAAGVVIALGSINSTAILILAKRDARAVTWRQAALPLLVGTIFALMQIALISYLRFSFTGTMTGLPGL